MILPNFFIIGASKSGTTSLYNYLNQHPEVYMSADKEPAYFIYDQEEEKFEFKNDLVTDKFKKKVNNLSMYTYEEYLNFFKNAQNKKAIGEATPDYLMQPNSPAYIFRNVPHARIIALLRNPFDAAYSDYLMKKRDGVWKNNVKFLEVLKAENLKDKNLRSHPNLIRNRLYDHGIKRYLDTFSINQIKIFLYEDLKDPLALLNECFDLLEISKNFQPDVSMKYNTASAMSAVNWLSPLIQKVPLPIKKTLKIL